MICFHLLPLISEQLRTAQELTLVFSNLVKFLVPSLKAVQWLLSLHVKLHMLIDVLEMLGTVEQTMKEKDIKHNTLKDTSAILSQ